MIDWPSLLRGTSYVMVIVSLLDLMGRRYETWTQKWGWGAIIFLPLVGALAYAWLGVQQGIRYARFQARVPLWSFWNLLAVLMVAYVAYDIWRTPQEALETARDIWPIMGIFLGMFGMGSKVGWVRVASLVVLLGVGSWAAWRSVPPAARFGVYGLGVGLVAGLISQYERVERIEAQPRVGEENRV